MNDNEIDVLRGLLKIAEDNQWSERIYIGLGEYDDGCEVCQATRNYDRYGSPLPKDQVAKHKLDCKLHDLLVMARVLVERNE